MLLLYISGPVCLQCIRITQMHVNKLIKMLNVVKGTDLPWVKFATPCLWCESKEQKPSAKFAARYKKKVDFERGDYHSKIISETERKKFYPLKRFSKAWFITEKLTSLL